MNLLAFDTSTEMLSVALRSADGRVRTHEGEGGTQASATLIPTVMGLLADAGLSLGDLQAIVFGRGPGSFTGLRTACAVAQGLAFGAQRPVLPVDTLLALAEDAHAQSGATRVIALLDARMDEVYTAAYVREADGLWREVQAPSLRAPEQVGLPTAASSAAGDTPSNPSDASAWTLASNAFAAYGTRLPAAVSASPRVNARPSAEALLRLAPELLHAGHAVSADAALPLYIRDKVAHTTAERDAIKAAKEAALHAGAAP